MIRILLSLLLCGTVVQGACQGLQVKRFSPALEERLSRVAKDGTHDSVDLVVQWEALPIAGQYRLLRQSSGDIQVLRVSAAALGSWLRNAPIKFAGLYQQPKEELTTGSLDLTLNKLNAAHRAFPQTNGSATHISIKEQRFDTADIDLRGRILASGVEAPSATTHASLMATIAAGGGNSSEEARGAAPGARISSSSFTLLLPDADTTLTRLGVQVQNHSYGTVVENLYGPEALAYDRQAYALPRLLHVFSAGNSGQAASAGPYTGVAGLANLTGNFKYAKNVLTVGALDSFGSVAPASSKGPAFDGRVKPELTAFGEDGSSGAAALVSGTAVLVQQAILEATGQAPPSGLVRAILLNSAFEVGAPGPDYQSGWGGLDGLTALRTVAGRRYRLVQLAKGSTQTVAIEVPAGMHQLKVTISWTDVPAAAGTTKALVNDVDLQVQRQGSGQIWRPWVLNPHRDSLNQPARRGVDTLNTNEQVSIANPTAGTYLLQLDGRRLVQDQEVAIAWQMDTANTFAFTFPVRHETLEAGKKVLVRWEGTLDGNGTLEYSAGGNTWQRIADGSLAQQYATWIVPAGAATLQLRMRMATRTFLSDTFVVSQRPELEVGFLCSDSVLLYWSATDAPAYQVYRLGQRYMEPVEALADSFAVLQVPSGDLAIYSVAPLVQGIPATRSFALNARAAGVGCYFRGFFVQGQSDKQIDLRASLGSLYRVQSVRLQKRLGNVFRDISGRFAPSLSIAVADSALIQGYNFYRLVLVLDDGREVVSEELAVFHFGSNPVQAYPNPVRRGTPLVLQSSLPGKYEVQVFDLYGRLVQVLRLREVVNRVPVQWPAGVYFLRITSDEGKVATNRVVVY